MPQPQPQYVHVVTTSRSGSSNSVNASEPVGQRTTHSPQETQSESIHCASGALPMVVSKPRFTKSMAATPDDLVAGAHADPAEHADVRIELEERVRRVRGERPIRSPQAPQPRLVDADEAGDPLQLAGVAFLAVHGSPVVVDEEELDGAESRLLHRVRVGADPAPLR